MATEEDLTKILSLSTEEILSRARSYWQRLTKLEEYLKVIMPKIARNYPSLTGLSARISASRQLLLDRFKQEKFLNICSECGGDCCRGQSYRYLFDGECFLFCLPEMNKGIIFPEPRWQDVIERNHCLFWSSGGCLLKEYRPDVCLRFLCSKMRNITDSTGRKTLVRNELLDATTFFERVLWETPVRFFRDAMAFTYFRRSVRGLYPLYPDWDESFEELKKKVDLYL